MLVLIANQIKKSAKNRTKNSVGILVDFFFRTVRHTRKLVNKIYNVLNNETGEIYPKRLMEITTDDDIKSDNLKIAFPTVNKILSDLESYNIIRPFRGKITINPAFLVYGSSKRRVKLNDIYTFGKT